MGRHLSDTGNIKDLETFHKIGTPSFSGEGVFFICCPDISDSILDTPFARGFKDPETL